MTVNFSVVSFARNRWIEMCYLPPAAALGGGGECFGGGPKSSKPRGGTLATNNWSHRMLEMENGDVVWSQDALDFAVVVVVVQNDRCEAILRR